MGIKERKPSNALKVFRRLIGILIGLGASLYFDSSILLILSASALLFVWFAHKKNESRLEEFLSTFIIAIVFGYFIRLRLLITSALILFFYCVHGKIAKPALKPMIPAVAILGVLMLWSNFSLEFRYTLPALYETLWLDELKLEIIILAAGLLWLIIRPGIFPVIFLSLYQGSKLISYLYLFIQAGVENSSLIISLGYLLLLLQLLLGTAAILLMFHGLKSKKTGKSWYFPPGFLNIIGGIAGTVRDRDKKLAKNLLYIGLGIFLIILVLPRSPCFEPTNHKDIINSIGMEFIQIQECGFYNGSPPIELPVRKVLIPEAFYIGKHEVTQKQWRGVMGNNPSYFRGDDLPIENVTWHEVQEFIKKLNEKEGTSKYRLPSGDEWEYAAKAGTTTRFFFGDNISELKEYDWHGGNSNNKTHPVGQKKPNPWGLYDIYGNVFELTPDELYFDNIHRELGNPYRVVMGGGWDIGPGFDILFPNFSTNNIGFRLVRDL